MFAVIMNGDPPFAIVILEQHGSIQAGPGAPLICHGCTAHKSDRLPRSVTPSLYVAADGTINLPGRRGAHRHRATTSRGAYRPPKATVSRSRRPVGVRSLRDLRCVAPFQAMSARS